MRKTIKDIKNMRFDLSERFYQVSRQRARNAINWKEFGDVAYLNETKRLDNVMQSICDKMAYLDTIEVRHKNFSTRNRGTKSVTNGVRNIKIMQEHVDTFLKENPDWRLGMVRNNKNKMKLLLSAAMVSPDDSNEQILNIVNDVLNDELD